MVADFGHGSGSLVDYSNNRTRWDLQLWSKALMGKYIRTDNPEVSVEFLPK
jgi:hypothetical protein